jgi:phage terminase small subunit
MNQKRPTAPVHLSPSTRTWWRAVCDEYTLEPHHLRLLQLAGEAWDRAQDARAIIAAEGLIVVDDRKNPRAHPAVVIEKDARTAFARLVRELDLDGDTAPVGPRPPSLRSNRRGA